MCWYETEIDSGIVPYHIFYSYGGSYVPFNREKIIILVANIWGYVRGVWWDFDAINLFIYGML